MRGPTGGAHVGGLERVEPTGGPGVGDPAAADDAACGLDVGEQELLQAVGASVLYDTQTNAPKTPGATEFHRRSEQHLAQRARPVTPGSGPPRKASSTSTSPVSRSRPGRTMSDR